MMSVSGQQGVVLIISLVFLLMLSLLAGASMQNATLQEKVAGSLSLHESAFQNAETLLRTAEAQLTVPGFAKRQCSTPKTCLPPPEALGNEGAPIGDSGVQWVASAQGYVGIQYLGLTDDPAGRLPHEQDKQHALYRVTAIGVQGAARSVLESIHTQERRIMWRQRR